MMPIPVIRLQSLPGFVQEATGVCKESTVDWVQDRELSQGLHGEQQHEADDHEGNQLSTASAFDSNESCTMDAYHTARSTVVKCSTRAHEKTSTD